jgi:hydroxymethylbilane synthase
VAGALKQLHAQVPVQLLPLVSQGDQQTDQPLWQAGGKGQFTGTVEQALLDGRADLAVHSLKDLPVAESPGLVLAAIPPRGDVRDALISTKADRLDDLPPEARVGTSSARRAAQLRRRRPDLRIEPIRGLVQTRLMRVTEAGDYDATLLAVAGLQRAGLGRWADKPIPVDQMLPAAGQAALAVQCRADDHVTIRRCLPLNDAMAHAAVAAERAVVSALGADCHWPLAALAEVTDDQHLRLRVQVFSHDGTQCLSVDEQAPIAEARHLCHRVAARLIEQGARQIMQADAARSHSS